MSAISLLPSNPRRRIRQQAVVVYWSRCTSLPDCVVAIASVRQNSPAHNGIP
jgi:hypothetical protein